MYKYKIKTERAFKVIIRHLYLCMQVNDFKIAVMKEGHSVRNVVNIRQWRIKHSLATTPFLRRFKAQRM